MDGPNHTAARGAVNALRSLWGAVKLADEDKAVAAIEKAMDEVFDAGKVAGRLLVEAQMEDRIAALASNRVSKAEARAATAEANLASEKARLEARLADEVAARQDAEARAGAGGGRP